MLVRLPPLVAKQDSVLNTYRSLVEVNALAQQRFVLDIPEDRLVEGAIRGMLRQLDPYSGYIAPDELTAFLRRSAGEYIGIGVELGMRDGRIAVISPIDQSPAARAGIVAGDVIIAIDGQDVREKSVLDVDERLGGLPGQNVTLTILRKGAEKAQEIVVARGPISLSTVRGVRRKGNGKWDYYLTPEERIAYIRVSGFRETTTRKLDEVLAAIDADSLDGVILDLRSNPGGLMDQAVLMVDRFINHGLIVATMTRRGVEQEYHATAGNALTRPTVVVLVNHGSASSAEIVSGALQDQERATIIGTRTFGKGSMQHLIALETQSAAIKLTVGVYRLPSGRIIHRTQLNAQDDSWGVIPDIKVELDDKEEMAVQRWLSHSAAMESAAPGSHDRPDEPFDRQLLAAIEYIRLNPPSAGESSSGSSLTTSR
jgi:carboxyl-terminal processing protease